jgi:hypothetical protein
MRNVLVLFFAFALLFNSVGCGSELKGEKEMKKMIDAMKEASELKDPTKAFESLGKMMAAAKELEDLKLTPEEKTALRDKYKSDLEKYEKKGK